MSNITKKALASSLKKILSKKEFNKITTKAYAEMAKKLPKAYGSIYWKSEKGPLAHISTTSNKLLSIKINKLLKIVLLLKG